jgi:hypothetical protein
VTANSALADRASNLCRKSVKDYYNPYIHFDWPDVLSDDQLWMPVDLLSLYGTPLYEELTDRQVRALTKWESINFYSLNVHGIREVLDEVVARIHTAEFAHVSDYLHHFIGEENEHMWFFAKFCTQYGGKIYTERALSLDDDLPQTIRDFLVFVRTVIFEEIVDYYNVQIGQDTTLHPIIQAINTTHHKDESRHVAFGREIVRELYRAVVARHGSEGAAKAETYVRRYLSHCIDLFYQAPVYRDAGLPDPFKLRNQARNAPERAAFHRKMLARTVNFLVAEGILKSGEIQ